MSVNQKMLDEGIALEKNLQAVLRNLSFLWASVPLAMAQSEEWLNARKHLHAIAGVAFHLLRQQETANEHIARVLKAKEDAE